jgi:TolB-like protein/tRNA A-37 threonylcarbamoyl transferase component Bud32/Tfp pilus assembly protein PilF
VLTPERWQHIERLYLAALERDASQRTAFLNDVCGSDEALRREIESLLEHQEDADRFIETPALEIAAKWLAEDTRPTLTGRQIGSHYHVLERIGAGGMGVVYKARDARLDRDVALKMLHANALADDAAGARLLREARLAASLNHPHICTIYDVGETDGHFHIAMELVIGRPLSDVIPFDGLPLESVVRYGAQIADALGYAHDQGVVHRDLKGANVLVAIDGRVKILDFGIATRQQKELADATRSRASVGGPGVVTGTLPYMAPEVLRGGTADARSDIWALGVVLYEMASGHLPFSGQTGFELTSAILRDVPAPLPIGVAAGIATIILRCLSKDPSQRYQHAAEVRAAIEAVASSVHSKVVRPPYRMAGRRSVAPLLMVSAIVLAVVLVAAGTRAWRGRTAGAAGPKAVRSLAVLPLENLSGDPTQDYFVDGVTQELITRLSKIAGLTVISRTTVMQFKGAHKPLPEIAEQLGVEVIVEGSVARSADRARVTAQVVDARSDKTLWAESYDRPLGDVLAIQAEVASASAGEILTNISPQERMRLAAARAVSPEGYDFYLRGKFHANRLNAADNDQAIGFFERAVAADPRLAAAHAELARVYCLRVTNYALGESHLQERAFVEIERALAIDPDSDDAYMTRGLCLWQHMNHFPHEGAIADFRRAIALNPKTDEGHHLLAVVYLHIGLLDEAWRELEQTLRLNPTNTLARYRQGVVSLFQGRYAQARDILSQTPSDFAPSLVAFQSADTFFHLGLKQEAATTAAEYLAKHPDDAGGMSTSIEALLAADRGDASRAERLITRAEEKGAGFGHFHHTAYTIARAYATLGRGHEAVAWLRRAADDGLPCYPLFANDPNLIRIRGDQIFQDFLAQQKSRWNGFKRLAR